MFGDWQEGDVVTINTTMAEADFSNKKLGPLGALVLASFLNRKFFQDNGALSNLVISGNAIGEEGKASIAASTHCLEYMACDEWVIMEGTVSLDLSGKGLSIGDINLLSSVLKNNGVLVNLNVSNNSLGPEGAKALVPAM